MIFLKSTLLFIGGFLMLLFFALPILMLPFVNQLPYLGTLTFFYKLLYLFLIFVFSYVIIIVGAKPQNRDGSIAMLKSNITYTIISFIFFIVMGAWLSVNSLGLLVKIIPNKLYFSKFEVINSKERGSKYKFVNLDLKSNTDGKIYYLTLSKDMFNYPKFNVGDKLVLKGKQNWFGVYVEEFQPAE